MHAYWDRVNTYVEDENYVNGTGKGKRKGAWGWALGTKGKTIPNMERGRRSCILEMGLGERQQCFKEFERLKLKIKCHPHKLINNSLFLLVLNPNHV